MGKSGGGSGAGANSWPVHMSNIHHQWLDNWDDDDASRPWADDIYPNVAETMANAMTAVGGNPFTGAVAYSPDLDLSNSQDAIDDFNADLAAGWTSFLTSSMAGIDATIASPVVFEGMENVVSDRVRREQNKGLALFNARALDIGAIQTSTYAMALVMQEQDARDRVYEFITAQEERILVARHNLLAQLGVMRMDGARAVADQQGRQTQLQIVSKSEEQGVNQQWENAEATWDLDLFQYGNNVLASMSGGTTGAKDQTQTGLQKALSSVMMGASTSLALGAAGVGATT
ncbi:hypothetical protein LCGC14_1712520, partial [marine sediment metagenome]